MFGKEIALVAKSVEEMLANEGSGHDWLHIQRVWKTAMKLARSEGAREDIVALSALLHDVDDRKVTGDVETETTLPNARRIMAATNIDDGLIETVCNTIKMTGFHKSIGRKVERSLEAHILSDADQLDAIGSVGIARTFVYGASKGRPMFTPDEAPMEENFSPESYRNNGGSTICHFFDKLLKLRTMMFTSAGKREANIRHGRMVDYLDNFFDEVAAPVEWRIRLDAYRDRPKAAA